MRQARVHYQSGITRYEKPRSGSWLRRTLALLLLVALGWTALPVVRTGLLFWSNPLRHGPGQPRGLQVKSITFHASDGVFLRGWFVPSAPRAAAIVLVSGFKDDRSSMVPYARFLHAAGFNVLLYDSRGTGASDGTFSLGLREVNDVRGAVAYLQHRTDVRGHRYGLLGVSLGAGVAIVAASRLPEVAATVADSAYVDQHALVDRLNTVRLGPAAIPLAPLAPWTADAILGTGLDTFSPLRAVSRIAPRALLLVHSRHDTNPTTPLDGARRLYRAAGANAAIWIAPLGGHAGARAAQPSAYSRRVVAFFRHYLR